jgi:monoamine oxidase
METEAENIKHKPDTHRPSRGHFIVVGAGFGGLSAAIELNSKGFDVDIFESAKELLPLGMF